jgi:myosin heavy subunit
MLDKPLKEYWFVAQAELSIEGVNDKEEHQATDEAFDVLLFSPEEKMNCYKIIAAIMHMGIMKFKQRPREEQAGKSSTFNKTHSFQNPMALMKLKKPRQCLAWIAKPSLRH